MVAESRRCGWTIEGDVDDDLRSIRELVRLAAEVFAEKAGISYEQYEALRKRIQQELKNYDEMLRQRWQKIFRIGAVFQIIGGGRFREDITDLFEVVDIFDLHGYLRADHIVLVRQRWSGLFTTFMDTDVAELLPVGGVDPIYTNSPDFIRVAVGGQFPVSHHGFDIRETGAVFEYHFGEDPRNGVWETFFCYWRVGGDDEEVVIARCHDRPLIAEFEGSDLLHIKPSERPRKFINKGLHWTAIPVLDINS